MKHAATLKGVIIHNFQIQNEKYAKSQELKENRTQLQPSKPKRKITNITNSQNTKRTYGQPIGQLFPKRWPLSNRNRTKNKIVILSQIIMYVNPEVRVSVMFHFMFFHYTISSVWVAEWPPLGK